MRDIPKLIGKALLAILKGIAIVVFGIPFLIASFLIPNWVWKPLVQIGAVLLFYRYVYPHRYPLPDAEWLWHHFVGLSLNLYGSRAKAALWLRDDTHRAVLTLAGGAIAFLWKTAKDRKKEKRTLKEKFDSQEPKLTVVFTLAEDGTSTCTVINVGAGNAMSVKFRFYVWDDIHDDDDLDSGSIKIRSRMNVLLPDEKKQFWRLRESRTFAFVAPHARQPKAVPLGIVPAEPHYGIRVELECVDTLDRRYFQIAEGGQSRDHTFMSVGMWHTSIQGRTYYRSSSLGDLAEAASFYIGKFLKPFGMAFVVWVRSLDIKIEKRHERRHPKGKPEDASGTN